MSRRLSCPIGACAFLILAGAACSSASGSGGGYTPAVDHDAGDASVDVLNTETSTEADVGLIQPDASYPDGHLVQEPPCANADLNGDLDHDGWSVAEGDCNDCTPLMNPGAFDYVDGVDEDCDGIKDNEPLDCDQGLAVDATDPMDAAKALGLCRIALENAVGKDRTWGVLSARYLFPDGSATSGTPKNFGVNCTGTGGQGAPPNPLSHGIVPSFGQAVVPRQGGGILLLSSGVARSGFNGDSPGGAHMCTKSGMPSGYPIASSAACPNQDIDDQPIAYDGIALELRIRAPSNAKSFVFDFDFYTYEYPDFVCSRYNDFFVALMSPAPAGAGVGGNVCFDAQGNPVSVNNGFLEACIPGTHGGKSFTCPLGISELEKTGFDGRGATGWLQTSGPIAAGAEFTVRFAIWDMGDDAYDSTVLLDDFHWELDELPPSTVRPPK
jgi:hypothetical protein